MDAIRRAALHMLLTTGPDHVTIRDIADQAEVAHVYIPQYFGGKAELFADIYLIANEEAAQAFTWPETSASGIRPELLRLARLALWLAANHPNGVPAGPRSFANRLSNFLTEHYQLDASTAHLLTERLIALVTMFAGAPTVVSPDPIDLAAHIDLEVRILTALANESAQDSSR
jgi:AcrR family transcriptional regulator